MAVNRDFGWVSRVARCWLSRQSCSCSHAANIDALVLTNFSAKRPSATSHVKVLVWVINVILRQLLLPLRRRTLLSVTDMELRVGRRLPPERVSHIWIGMRVSVLLVARLGLTNATTVSNLGDLVRLFGLQHWLRELRLFQVRTLDRMLTHILVHFGPSKFDFREARSELLALWMVSWFLNLLNFICTFVFRVIVRLDANLDFLMTSGFPLFKTDIYRPFLSGCRLLVQVMLESDMRGHKTVDSVIHRTGWCIHVNRLVCLNFDINKVGKRTLLLLLIPLVESFAFVKNQGLAWIEFVTIIRPWNVGEQDLSLVSGIFSFSLFQRISVWFWSSAIGWWFLTFVFDRARCWLISTRISD